VFEESEENHQLLGPAGDLFEKLATAGGGTLSVHPGEGGAGVCWIVEIESTRETVFLVQTLDGLRRIQTVGELSLALERVGEPVVFPFDSWPGSIARLVA
jgi:hypothetical protein